MPTSGRLRQSGARRACRERLTDLADQQVCRPERGIIAFTPEQTDSTGELREVRKEGPTPANLAAVETGPTHAVGLDVHRFLGEVRGIAQHVHEQVVAGDLAEKALVAAAAL